MTTHKAHKQRVRTRMAKTGERYTTARRQLLAKAPTDPSAETEAPSQAETEAPAPTEAAERSPAEAIAVEAPAAAGFRGDRAASDEALIARTGRPWDAWAALLDGWGAADRPHPEIARWLNTEHGVNGWWAQELTVRYEMAIGRRQQGQRPDGFSVSVSKTVGVPVERLFAAFVEAGERAAWLPGVVLPLRTATSPRTARFDWDDGARLAIGFTAKGGTRSTAAMEIARLSDPDAADGARAFWRAAFERLQAHLEAER